MLGKLISYEFRGVWKPALIVLVIMVAAGIAGTMSFGTANAISDSFSYSVSDAATDLSIVLMLFTLFAGFLIWAGIIALFAIVVVRFYRTMFTDEGYLTLTLPVSTAALVLAKFLVAYLVMLAGVVVAVLLYSIMFSTYDGLFSSGIGEGFSGSFTMILSLLGGSFAFLDDFNGFSMAMGVLNTAVAIGYQLALAFLSLTLGAWWAKRHKVAAAVGIYLAIGWVLSLFFSIASVLAFVGDIDVWAASSMVTGVQMACDACLAVGAMALSVFLVRRKVDLS